MCGNSLSRPGWSLGRVWDVRVSANEVSRSGCLYHEDYTLLGSVLGLSTYGDYHIRRRVRDL